MKWLMKNKQIWLKIGHFQNFQNYTMEGHTYIYITMKAITKQVECNKQQTYIFVRVLLQTMEGVHKTAWHFEMKPEVRLVVEEIPVEEVA